MVWAPILLAVFNQVPQVFDNLEQLSPMKMLIVIINEHVRYVFCAG